MSMGKKVWFGTFLDTQILELQTMSILLGMQMLSLTCFFPTLFVGAV